MTSSYRVTGSHAVAGVAPGGTVELDPARVNIAALLAGGHVEEAAVERPKVRPGPPRVRTGVEPATAEEG